MLWEYGALRTATKAKIGIQKATKNPRKPVFFLMLPAPD